MEKETMQVFEKEQQTSENKVDDLEKEITQGELEERGQSENDSGTVPEEPSPSSPPFLNNLTARSLYIFRLFRQIWQRYIFRFFTLRYRY